MVDTPLLPVENARATTKRRQSDPAVWPSAYFAALARTGMQVASAEAAGVDARTVCRRRKADPVFAAEEQDTLQVAKLAAEDELRRRAVEGVSQKFFDRNGNVTSEKVEYSDTLLLRLLEKLDPTWRQKHQMDVTGGLQFDTRETRAKALAEARQAFAAGTS